MTEHDQVVEQARDVWQCQPAAGLHMSPTELAMRIQADDRSLRRWFRMVYAIIGIQAAAMIAVLVAFRDPIQRIGAALILGAMVYLAYQMRVHVRRVRTARADVERITTSSTDFVMAYLQTRREFHSGVWFWSRLVVVLPGLPILVYGLARAEVGPTPLAYAIVAAFAAMVVLAIVVQRAIGRGYQRQIDELSRLRRAS